MRLPPDIAERNVLLMYPLMSEFDCCIIMLIINLLFIIKINCASMLWLSSCEFPLKYCHCCQNYALKFQSAGKGLEILPIHKKVIAPIIIATGAQ